MSGQLSFCRGTFVSLDSLQPLGGVALATVGTYSGVSGSTCCWASFRLWSRSVVNSATSSFWNVILSRTALELVGRRGEVQLDSFESGPLLPVESLVASHPAQPVGHAVPEQLQALFVGPRSGHLPTLS